jgi:hypothetical protein
LAIARDVAGVYEAPVTRLLFFFFLRFDEAGSLVGAAFWAEVMRLAQGAALRAGDQVDGGQRIMGAAAIAAALG